MLASDYRWRDRILLFLVWAPLVLYSAGIWAERASRASLLALLALILALPVLVIVSRLLPAGHVREELATLFQSQYTCYVLLGGFALGQLLRLDPRYRDSVPFDIVSLDLAMLILLWLFWHRRRIAISQVALVGTWMLALVTIRTTLMSLEGRVDFTQSSWLTKAYVGLNTAFLLGIILLPVLLAISRTRSRLAGALGAVARQPLWVNVLVLGLASCAYAVHLITGEGLFRLELLTRLAALGATFALGAIALRIDASSVPWVWAESWPMGRRGYALGLLLTLLLYCVLAARIGVLQLNNIEIDGLAYLTIARRYASGEMAVRGYWSPLISWALAPIIASGASPQVALRLLNGLVGVGWILVAARLGAQAGLNLFYRLALAVGAGLTALRYGFVPTTPDVLGALLLTLYFICIMRTTSSHRPVFFAAAPGLLGALAYYGKYYNLPFILAHILLSGLLLRAHGRPWRRVAATTLTVLGTLCFAAAPWFLALGTRYGTFTITTSGPINHADVGPNWDTRHPCTGTQPRICDHPADVLFPFEDPQPEYYRDYGWSPFASLGNFRHQIFLVRTNLEYLLAITVLGWGPLFPLAVLVLGIVVLAFWAEPGRRFPSRWLLLTILLHPAGYMLTWSFETRFFVALIPLALLAFYGLSQTLIRRLPTQLPGGLRSATAALVLISAATPLLPLVDFPQMASRLTTPSSTCREEGSRLISDVIVPPFAGTSVLVNDIAFYTSKRTIGVLALQSDPATADAKMRESEARTLLAPSDSHLTQGLTSRGYEVVLTAPICGTTYAVLRVPVP